MNKISCLLFGIALLTSCSMMHEDLDECPLRITLRYDYNTKQANMFHDHVEEATVYVVDPQTGIVVDQQTARNSNDAQPLRSPSFAFVFTGLNAGDYRLYATGRSAADAHPVINAPATGQAISTLTFALPAAADGNVAAQRMDTVWNTLKPTTVTMTESAPAEAVVPLMRLTNDLNVMIFRRDADLDNSHERYDVRVEAHHPRLGYDNEPLSDDAVTYRPFAAWTTETDTTSTRAAIAERNAHYDLSLGRLFAHNDARQNARLIITDRTTGKEVVNIDLCYYLALARNYFETQHYTTQEYLDREYDYRLDFGIEGSTWKTLSIHINILSWAIRLQNEDL